MDIHKTVKGVSLYARVKSLGEAQKMSTRKRRDRKIPADDFIGPMWISPEDKKKTTQ